MNRPIKYDSTAQERRERRALTARGRDAIRQARLEQERERCLFWAGMAIAIGLPFVFFMGWV